MNSTVSHTHYQLKMLQIIFSDKKKTLKVRSYNGCTESCCYMQMIHRLCRLIGINWQVAYRRIARICKFQLVSSSNLWSELGK